LTDVAGFADILKGCGPHGVEHLVYASTSSVCGADPQMPFSVHQNVNYRLSFSATTKKILEKSVTFDGATANTPIRGAMARNITRLSYSLALHQVR
jgi:nucleoside-diphosphate-sugar epimerase